jgi:hypothetical protein
MNRVLHRNRRAVQLENDEIRLTVLEEGGHIASIEDKRTGINPLWTPPWESIEPSTYRVDLHPQYGSDSESKLLSGLMGHNLALDLFGPPSPEEFAAGLTAHGESSMVPYQFEPDEDAFVATAHLPLAQLSVKRLLRLRTGGMVDFEETVTNLLAMDRPIAWTEHVTLGPPFVEPGVTRLAMPVSCSVVFDGDLGRGSLYQRGQVFQWPMAPFTNGTLADLTVYPAQAPSTAVTAHQILTNRENAFFLSWQPRTKMLFGYFCKREDFPWISLWQEHRARLTPPWNGEATTWGIEFGVSPYAEERSAMLKRHPLFGETTYRWLPARSKASIRYRAFLRPSDCLPDELPPDLAAAP